MLYPVFIHCVIEYTQLLIMLDGQVTNHTTNLLFWFGHPANEFSFEIFQLPKVTPFWNISLPSSYYGTVEGPYDIADYVPK